MILVSGVVAGLCSMADIGSSLRTEEASLREGERLVCQRIKLR
jgi:hypothetical protein